MVSRGRGGGYGVHYLINLGNKTKKIALLLQDSLPLKEFKLTALARILKHEVIGLEIYRSWERESIWVGCMKQQRKGRNTELEILYCLPVK